MRIPRLDYDMFERQLAYSEHMGIRRRYEEAQHLKKQVHRSYNDLDKLSKDAQAAFWVQYAFGFDMKRLDHFFFTLLDRCERGYGHQKGSTLLEITPDPNDPNRYHSYKNFVTLWQSMTSFVSNEQRIQNAKSHELMSNVQTALKNQTPDFVMVLQMLLLFSDRLPYSGY